MITFLRRLLLLLKERARSQSPCEARCVSPSAALTAEATPSMLINMLRQGQASLEIS